jgi:hypothetical protein
MSPKLRELRELERRAQERQEQQERFDAELRECIAGVQRNLKEAFEREREARRESDAVWAKVAAEWNEIAQQLRPQGHPKAWETLGLQPGASVAEIKAAYRRKVKEVHPDIGGDAKRFRWVQRAYEHLMSVVEDVPMVRPA